CSVDLAEHLLGVLLERVVDLAVDRRRRRLGGGGVGARRNLFRLLLHPTPVPHVQVLHRLRDPPAPHHQSAPEGLDVQDRIHTASAPAAAASRRSASAGSMPSSATTLFLDACPDTSVTLERGTASTVARSATTASLARPRSGASATRTFQASPI